MQRHGLLVFKCTALYKKSYLYKRYLRNVLRVFLLCFPEWGLKKKTFLYTLYLQEKYRIKYSMCFASGCRCEWLARYRSNIFQVVLLQLVLEIHNVSITTHLNNLNTRLKNSLFMINPLLSVSDGPATAWKKQNTFQTLLIKVQQEVDRHTESVDFSRWKMKV